MDVDQDSSDIEATDKLVDSSEKKKLECTPKIIIFIIVGNLIFIALNIVLIHFYSLNKVNFMTSEMNDYVKNLTKIAITDKRILHLIKTENDAESKYQKLVDLQKIVLNATYEFLKSNGFDSLLKDMNNITFSNVLKSYKEDPSNPISFIEDLYRVLTQKEDWRIYQLMDNYDLKTINDAIFENTGDKYKEQLKYVILYGLIDLPFQVLYFSNNSEIRNKYIETIKTKLNPDTINNTINTVMQDYKIQTNDILMVLGCDQKEEENRIKAINDIIINLANTGLRTQSTENEAKTLKDNFKDFYMNDKKYKSLMKDCLEETNNYEKFFENGKKIIEQYAEIGIEEICQHLNQYKFSVETANTVINYLNLGESNETIHIIRLDGKQSNDDIKYNKSDIFILYNLHDTDSTTEDKTNRATTYSNAQAIKYLKNEYPNFLTEEQYNNITLVSSRGDAERQLEAFNIASNITNITDEQNKIRRWNQVIWNKKEEKENLNGNETIKIMLETLVKSYHLYAEKCEMKNEDLAKDYVNLIKIYKNISV